MPNTEHELMTDLTVILGYLEMAAAQQVDIDPPAAERLLERARRVADQLMEDRPPTSDYLFGADGSVSTIGFGTEAGSAA